MKNHLRTLPEGIAASRKLKLIRLIKKSAMIQELNLTPITDEMNSILSEFRFERFISSVPGISAMNYSLLRCRVSETGKRGIEEFQEKSCSLHELFFWRDIKTDSVCELFPLDSCPPFTFFSHRWAPNQKALGLHNELVLLLSLAPVDYIWLDCSCAPQSSDNVADGDCLKIVWNIDLILEQSANLLCYYATDGFQVTQIQGVQENVFSHGLLSLYKYATQCEDSFLGKLLDGFDATGSSRLWCLFEKKIAKHKIVKDFQTVAYPVSRDLSPEGELHMPTFTDLHTYVEQTELLHASNLLSLDCFDSKDIEPLCFILYRKSLLPCLIHDNLPMIIVNGEKRHGFRLPKKPKSTSQFTYYDLNETVSELIIAWK
jgi:hypothetical protein